MRSLRAAAPTALLLFAAISAARPFGPSGVAAVVSPPPGPYQAAFASFRREVGLDVRGLDISAASRASGAKVVVAFGGKAAFQTYSDSTVLIACLAPGRANTIRHGGPVVYVSMRPSPAKLLSEMKRLQPGLRRLAVLTRGSETPSYAAALKAAAPAGVEITVAGDGVTEDIPSALRALVSPKPDAVWLAPDPKLVTPESFQAIVQFSWDNDVPFYAPTRGLAQAGASASVYVSPEEIGRVAADLARRALAGETLPRIVYPEKTSIVVNVGSARKAGLRADPAALGPDVEALP